MTQLWKLAGYCPECNQTYKIEESEKVGQLVNLHAYYTRMLKDDRSVVQCKECGADYESFIVKPIYVSSNKRMGGVV